jgi:hypothetical protein
MNNSLIIALLSTKNLKICGYIYPPENKNPQISELRAASIIKIGAYGSRPEAGSCPEDGHAGFAERAVERLSQCD